MLVTRLTLIATHIRNVVDSGSAEHNSAEEICHIITIILHVSDFNFDIKTTTLPFCVTFLKQI